MWRLVTFTLVVDDFGVKFVGKRHAQHLENTLKRWHDITVDWTGEKYVGISLKWDYKNQTLDTSVPDFVKNKLHKFQHPTPSKPQHAPEKAAPINYRSKVKKPTPEDDSPPLSKEGSEYSRSTNPTMTARLGSLAGRQAKATEQ